MSKEYTYDIEKYTIGVDENGEDGIGLTVAMVENNEIKFLGNCYGDNARCIDLLIKENKQLKEQLHQKEDIINKAREIVENKFLETWLESFMSLETENYLKLKEILNIDKGDE